MKNYKEYPHLSNRVIKGIKGFKLDAFLIAYEGWRRGLRLKFYKDESSECDLARLNSSISGKFFSLSSSEGKHYFFRSRGDKVGNEDVLICQNKEKTKNFLKNANVPVPVGEKLDLNSHKEIIMYAEKIGYPVVIKPVSGSMGRGIFINIQDSEELQDILNHYKKEYKYKKCIIEKHYNGKEYRIYVVGNEVISAVNRVPANVIGDGVNSIISLIAMKNKERKKNPYLASKPIKVDYEVNNMLKKQGFDKNSTPKQNSIVFLREISNLSTGGEPIDETEKITNEIKKIAVDALKALPSIHHGGVDVIVDKDDSRKGVVLEINATAEISFHLFPIKGTPKDLPSKIIDYYFPESVNQEKTSFYFDYNSILQPLTTWSAKVVEVNPAPRGKLFRSKIQIEGKVLNVGYLTWVKRQALMRELHGSVRKKGENHLEVEIIGKDKDVVNDFIKICKKGSKKSDVQKISSMEIEITTSDIFRLGFKIIKSNKNKSKKKYKKEKNKSKKMLNIENAELRKEIELIKQSKSWKFSKPIRVIGNKLKK